MSANPYETPQTTSADEVRVRSYRYRPSPWIVGALTALFVLHIVADTGFIVLGVLNLSVFAEADLDAELDAMPLGLLAFVIVYAMFGLILIPVLVATVVLFCIWVYRANANARALGAQVMTFTPGWCAGWFFVPFMNLFKPYQAVREIYQASDPGLTGAEWFRSPVSPVIGWWWGAWLISNFLANAEMRLEFQSDPAMVETGVVLGIASSAVGILAAFCAMQVVRSIAARQAQKATRQAESSGVSPHALGGWQPDT